MSFQFEKKLREFTERGGSPATAKRVVAFVDTRADLLRESTTPVLCHNDLHSGNVLVTRDGGLHVTGIVDFEGALAGDPLMDVAKALYYERSNKQRVAALLAGYGPMERERWMETLDLYHLYFAVELWCWVTQHGNGEALVKAGKQIDIYST